jgi:hypothetical protein
MARILSKKSESGFAPSHSFCRCTTFWRGTVFTCLVGSWPTENLYADGPFFEGVCGPGQRRLYDIAKKVLAPAASSEFTTFEDALECFTHSLWGDVNSASPFDSTLRLTRTADIMQNASPCFQRMN